MQIDPPDNSTIDVYAGTDDSWEWEWIADGVGVDFTGCTAVFSPSAVPGTTPLLTVTTTPGPSGSISLGTLATEQAGGLARGQVILSLSAAATIAITTAISHGDLIITMSNGQKQEFLAIDMRFHGPLFLGMPGIAGGLAGPAGPPGLPGPGPGKTVNSAVYVLQMATDPRWIRADIRTNNVIFELGAATGDGDSRTFSVGPGAGGPYSMSVVSTAGANLRLPDFPWALASTFTTSGGSVTFTWSADTQEWEGT